MFKNQYVLASFLLALVGLALFFIGLFTKTANFFTYSAIICGPILAMFAAINGDVENQTTYDQPWSWFKRFKK